MREIRTSGSEGGGIEANRCSLPLSRLSCRSSASKTWMAGTRPAMTPEIGTPSKPRPEQRQKARQ
jgi:hypothetical protein